jgi:hypothetical protein
MRYFVVKWGGKLKTNCILGWSSHGGVRFEILNVVSMKVITAFWTLPSIIPNRMWHNWKMDLLPSSHEWLWEGTYPVVTTDNWINYIRKLQLYKLLAPGFVNVKIMGNLQLQLWQHSWRLRIEPQKDSLMHSNNCITIYPV